jgi:hypothetical protein
LSGGADSPAETEMRNNVESYKVVIKRIAADHYAWKIVKNKTFTVASGTATSRALAVEASNNWIDKNLSNFIF